MKAQLLLLLPLQRHVVMKERRRLNDLFELELSTGFGAEKVDDYLFRWDDEREPSFAAATRLTVDLVASAPDVGSFLDQLTGLEVDDYWLEHVPLWSTLTEGSRRQPWTWRGLGLRLAKRISGEPALSEATATTRLAVLQSTERLYCGVIVAETTNEETWSRRPFSFSGAANLEVAKAMANLIDCRAKSVVDPCCGSGTLLYAAALAGAHEVTGFDLNKEAIDGARRNFDHVCVDPSKVHLAVRDGRVPSSSSSSSSRHDDDRFDAMLLNLPWGEKVKELYHGDNDVILRNAQRDLLKQGAMAAVLARDRRSETNWRRLGYDLLHDVDVGPGGNKRGKASFPGNTSLAILRVV